MSKSLDNIIDPLDMIALYGTDAVRLSLVIGSTPGNDLNLPEERIAGFRNFTNKLWNITRFVFMNVSNVERVNDAPEPVTAADRWILGRLSTVHASVTQKLDEPAFALSQAGDELRDFTWSDFADWYIEVAKGQLKDDALRASTERVLLYVAQTLLKLWHPFMPFVTQRLWQEVDAQAPLMVEPWPLSPNIDEEKGFARIKEAVVAIRAVRAAYRVPPSAAIRVTIVSKDGDFWKDAEPMVRTLVSLGTYTVSRVAKSGNQRVVVRVEGADVYVHLEGAIDVEAEAARLSADLQQVEEYVKRVEKKLADKAFTKGAPPSVVEAERQKLEDARAKYDAYAAQLDALV